MDKMGDLTDREKYLVQNSNQLKADLERVSNEKLKAEAEFGKVRARFKDLYLEREQEINKVTDERATLERELNDVRTAALLTQSAAQDQLDKMRQHYMEEISILKAQLQDSKERIRGASFTKPNLNHFETDTPEDMESDMMQAQKNSQMLKDIVIPLETELKQVKAQCQQLINENTRLKMEERNLEEAKVEPAVDILLDLDDDNVVIAKEDNSDVIQELETKLAANDEQIEKLLSELDQIRSMCSGLKLQVNSVSSERDTLKNDYLILSDTHTLQLEESKTKMTELQELKRSVHTTEEKWNEVTTRYAEKDASVSETFKHMRTEFDTLKSEYEEYKKSSFDSLKKLESAREDMLEEVTKVKIKLSDERRNHEDAQALLTDSLESCRNEILRLENTREELTTSRELNDKLQNDVINLNDKVNEIQRKSKEVMMGLQKQILEKDNVLEELKGELDKTKKELAGSLSVRDELAIMSSELQVSLENHKDLLKSIKWEHEDDVTNCRRCDVLFTMTKRKSHCRKCGRIFCSDCSNRTIEHGPNKRAYKVCDECYKRHLSEMPTEYHTVLVSQEPK